MLRLTPRDRPSSREARKAAVMVAFSAPGVRQLRRAEHGIMAAGGCDLIFDHWHNADERAWARMGRWRSSVIWFSASAFRVNCQACADQRAYRPLHRVWRRGNGLNIAGDDSNSTRGLCY